MRQPRDERTEHLAERWCGAVARRLYRKPRVAGVDRLDEGAGRDDCLHGLDAMGVMGWLSDVHGTAMHQERVPFGPYRVLDGRQT